MRFTRPRHSGVRLTMQIDRIIYPISSLGPGDRLVIWTVGCDRRCAGCANPELWAWNTDKNVDVYDFIRQIETATNGQSVDGVTITGGDPLLQADELCVLLQGLRNITNDVLLFTGYTLKEAETAIPARTWAIIRKYVSVLIDGPYIEAMNDNTCALRGSANQNVIFFDESKRALYNEYTNKGREIQNVFYNNRMISVGIHNREHI